VTERGVTGSCERFDIARGRQGSVSSDLSLSTQHEGAGCLAYRYFRGNTELLWLEMGSAADGTFWHGSL
jgi:hypothetical protein